MIENPLSYVLIRPNIINEYGVPSFIKIDVEGYELSVLEGLTIPIECISVEFNSKDEILKNEEEIADTILKYYTDIGYELELNNTELRTIIPEN